MLAIKRSAQGPTRFVSLVSDESQSAAGTGFIRDPVRAGDLIDLLNQVSATLDTERPHDALPLLAPNEPAAGEGSDPFPVALTVRRLAKSATDEVFQLQTDILQLHVVPSARSVLLTQPINQDSIGRLAEPGIHVDVKQLPASHAQELVSNGAQACKVDALLWRLGLHGANSRLLPELSADGLFKLRRWPDFGRVEHTAEHLRLAAQLVRRQASVPDLAASTEQPVSGVTAFINACGLCELLEVHPVSATRQVQPMAPSTRTRSSSILQTIRSALRLGGSP